MQYDMSLCKGLVLLSLACRGQLPWSSASSDAECLRLKREFALKAFAAKCGCQEVRIIH